MGKFIYLTGADGTGKSTLAKCLLEYLDEQGTKVKLLWMRFPFIFSLPFLVYARARGFSWREKHDGVTYGYWDFRDSWMLKTLFPWVALFDAVLLSILFVYLPLWFGKTIVCERYLIDTVADFMVGCKDDGFHEKFPGKLFLRLLPRRSKIVVLELDIESIRQRRAALMKDKMLNDKLAAFRSLVTSNQFPIIFNNQAIDTVFEQMISIVNA